LAQGMRRETPKTPKDVDVYCSGVVTDKPLPQETYVISGEDSSYRNTYSQGDNVYLDRGAKQGVKLGDEFEVIRIEQDLLTSEWFKGQTQISHAMGDMYKDVARLQVFNVQESTAIAKVSLACDVVQLGDVARPFTSRQVPAFKEAGFDPFAPPPRKKTGLVVMNKHFGQVSGTGSVVYINLGNNQGVQVGNYFRFYRYQGNHNERLYQVRGSAYRMTGYGSTPVPYLGTDLPRQVIGEGIVLRLGPNSATVLITQARAEVFDGDYAEIE